MNQSYGQYLQSALDAYGAYASAQPPYHKHYPDVEDFLEWLVSQPEGIVVTQEGSWVREPSVREYAQAAHVLIPDNPVSEPLLTMDDLLSCLGAYMTGCGLDSWALGHDPLTYLHVITEQKRLDLDEAVHTILEGIDYLEPAHDDVRSSNTIEEAFATANIDLPEDLMVAHEHLRDTGIDDLVHDMYEALCGTWGLGDDYETHCATVLGYFQMEADWHWDGDVQRLKRCVFERFLRHRDEAYENGGPFCPLDAIEVTLEDMHFSAPEVYARLLAVSLETAMPTTHRRI